MYREYERSVVELTAEIDRGGRSRDLASEFITSVSKQLLEMAEHGERSAFADLAEKISADFARHRAVQLKVFRAFVGWFIEVRENKRTVFYAAVPAVFSDHPLEIGLEEVRKFREFVKK